VVVSELGPPVILEALPGKVREKDSKEALAAEGVSSVFADPCASWLTSSTSTNDKYQPWPGS
jgi:hypothetical protein